MRYQPKTISLRCQIHTPSSLIPEEHLWIQQEVQCGVTSDGTDCGLAYHRMDEGYTLTYVPSGWNLGNFTVPTEELAREWLEYVSMLGDFTQPRDKVVAASKRGKWLYKIPQWIAERREQIGVECACCGWKRFESELHEVAGDLLCAECNVPPREVSA